MKVHSLISLSLFCFVFRFVLCYFSLAGVSRSVTLTVAYMMTVTDYKWEDCLRAVKSSRTVAHPNFGFQRQLQEYEYSRLAEVQPAFCYDVKWNEMRHGIN